MGLYSWRPYRPSSVAERANIVARRADTSTETFLTAFRNIFRVQDTKVVSATNLARVPRMCQRANMLASAMLPPLRPLFFAGPEK